MGQVLIGTKLLLLRKITLMCFNKLFAALTICFFMATSVGGQIIEIKHTNRHPEYIQDFYRHHLILRAY
jgi:hypothetical protein